MSKPKILQIMPAPGWGAMLATEEGDEAVVPLVAWAIVEDAEGTRVVGMVADDEVELCDAIPDFSGYVSLQDLVSEVMETMGVFGDEEEGEEEEDDFPLPPPPPPSHKRKGGRLN